MSYPVKSPVDPELLPIIHVTEIPINARTGKAASATDPDIWSTFDEAVADYHRRHRDGINFTLSPRDLICAIDLDHCVDPETRAIDSKAQAPWSRSYWSTVPENVEPHESVHRRAPQATAARREQASTAHRHGALPDRTHLEF